MTFEQKIKDPTSEERKIIAEILGLSYNHWWKFVSSDIGWKCTKCGLNEPAINKEPESKICKYPDPPEGSLADIAFAVKDAVCKTNYGQRLYHQELRDLLPPICNISFSEITPEIMIKAAVAAWKSLQKKD